METPGFMQSMIFKKASQERMIKSVAKLPRQNGLPFFDTLKIIPVHTQTTVFSLSQAIKKLRKGQISGAAVLTMDSSRLQKIGFSYPKVF